MECPFCAIARGELKADIIYEDDNTLAFYDVNPQAPVHVLVIPKEHVPSANEVSDVDIWSDLMNTARKVVQELSLQGYRLVVNCGDEAGQTVPHLHIHLLAGRSFNWPPG